MRTTVAQRRNRQIGYLRIPIEASRGSLYDRVSVYIDRKGKRVRFQGGEQNGYLELSLPQSKSLFRSTNLLQCGWGIGHLLILRIGTELFGLSALDEGGQANARIL